MSKILNPLTGNYIAEGTAYHRKLVAKHPNFPRGKLTTGERNALPTSVFCLPGRRYPVHDLNHMKNALSRSTQYATPQEKVTIRKCIRKKAETRCVNGETQYCSMSKRLKSEGY